MKNLITCLVVCVVGIAELCMAQNIVITQNPDCDTDAWSMVACGGDGSTFENWFARNFYIDQDVTINSIHFGNANVTTVSANIFFSIASGPGNPEGVTLTPVGTATQALNAGPWYDTAVDMPFIVSAGSYLVVEFQMPDTGVDLGIWPASTTTATETTYLKAAECGITAYASVDAIGFSDAQMIMCLNATYCVLGYDCNTNGIDDCDDIFVGNSEDCNGNGIPDECDIADGSSPDVNEDGIPDECQDCNENGVLDDVDIAKGYSFDCNENGIPDECEDDCNGNTIPDDCETFADCNENGIPDECETFSDCNGNGLPDECETGNDCNTNGIPDECETGNDCNGNTIPDDCETFADCNENGIPDECETFSDCNSNGIPDPCETFGDCDENGVPDECEFIDCNGNGILDICDIANGIDEDCNGNGVLDSCDIVGGNYEFSTSLFPSGDGHCNLGSAISISDTVAVVGDFNSQNNRGLAHLFRFNGVSWVEEATFGPEDDLRNRFGESVFVASDIVVCGAPYADVNGENSGSIYIFRFDGNAWDSGTKIVASDGEAGDRFGSTVAISNNVIVVGAPQIESGGRGRVYVFRFEGNEWLQEAVVETSDGESGDLFGASVNIDGDVLVIGMPGDNENGLNAGSAYIYRFDGSDWMQETKLIEADGLMEDSFGSSVEILGDIVIVSAPYDDEIGANSGSVYIYRFVGDSWVLEDKLLPNYSSEASQFGKSISIDIDCLVIGNVLVENYYDSPAVYIYKFENGVWAVKSSLPVMWSPGPGWHLQINVSISGDNLMFGIFDISMNQYCSPNTCYMYTDLEADCNGNSVPDECDISEETSLDVNGNSIPDECECLADIAEDGYVNINDLLLLIAVWDTNTYYADINYDGFVNVHDLLLLIAAWGPCK